MLEALWLAEDAADATGGKLHGADSWIATGVSIDTRTLEPGDLFVALVDVRDGHEFVADAFAKGACAAVVSDLSKVQGAGNLLVVDDVLMALGMLGSAARDRSSSSTACAALTCVMATLASASSAATAAAAPSAVDAA